MASDIWPVEPVFHVICHAGFIRCDTRHTGADKTSRKNACVRQSKNTFYLQDINKNLITPANPFENPTPIVKNTSSGAN